MPLKDLRAHLQILKEKGEFGTDGVLVDMGKIVPQRTWYKKFLSIAAACIVFITAGVGIYYTTAPQDITFVMAMERGTDPQTIANIIAEGGGEVLQVKHSSGSTYEVKVSTRKNKYRFLEWLQKDKDVVGAVLSD